MREDKHSNNKSGSNNDTSSIDLNKYREEHGCYNIKEYDESTIKIINRIAEEKDCLILYLGDKTPPRDVWVAKELFNKQESASIIWRDVIFNYTTRHIKFKAMFSEWGAQDYGIEQSLSSYEVEVMHLTKEFRDVKNYIDLKHQLLNKYYSKEIELIDDDNALEALQNKYIEIISEHLDSLVEKIKQNSQECEPEPLRILLSEYLDEGIDELHEKFLLLKTSYQNSMEEIHEKRKLIHTKRSSRYINTTSSLPYAEHPINQNPGSRSNPRFFSQPNETDSKPTPTSSSIIENNKIRKLNEHSQFKP